MALLVAGCGDDSSTTAETSATTTEEQSPPPAPTTTTEEDSSSQKATEEAEKRTKPKFINVPDAPPQKLVVKDLEEGTGPAAKYGDEVTVNYLGVNFKTGQAFDASWDRGEPLVFELGSNSVIPGWEQGLKGMKVGGRRQLIIPPNLAYGSQGSSGIAPNSTLVFVVDLLEAS